MAKAESRKKPVSLEEVGLPRRFADQCPGTAWGDHTRRGYDGDHAIEREDRDGELIHPSRTRQGPGL